MDDGIITKDLFPQPVGRLLGTMIWLEQKLFWVFGFKSFIMLIEMQKRVGFSKILRKNQKIYTFYVAVLT